MRLLDSVVIVHQTERFEHLVAHALLKLEQRGGLRGVGALSLHLGDDAIKLKERMR